MEVSLYVVYDFIIMHRSLKKTKIPNQYYKVDAGRSRTRDKNISPPPFQSVLLTATNVHLVYHFSKCGPTCPTSMPQCAPVSLFPPPPMKEHHHYYSHNHAVHNFLQTTMLPRLLAQLFKLGVLGFIRWSPQVLNDGACRALVPCLFLL